eukprot:TRINITY_DN31292_c0_g1_i1.p1 TRINITY_DN31292_c0_g1~~TRINITY_DN31292_c0_g1_i1.p1  ORF type:complete len:288 (+),score=58.26 TRINITY_DN31292_c0_g1_i1:66-929(+)
MLLCTLTTIVAMAGVRESLIEAALKSPEMVGAQDKQGWLNLFVEGGVIEDPVGGTFQSTEEDRSRFWDMFIKDKGIDLIPECEDIVDEKNHVVVRTLNIRTKIYGGSVLNVPLHVLYTFQKESFKVEKLQAFWDASESSPVSKDFADMPSFVFGSISVLKQIYDFSSLGWLGEYLSSISLHNCGPAGREIVRKLVSDGDRTGLFAPDATIVFPLQDRVLIPADADSQFPTDLEIFNVHSSGKWVSFSIKLPETKSQPDNGIPVAGVGFVRFTSASELVIEEVMMYTF